MWNVNIYIIERWNFCIFLRWRFVFFVLESSIFIVYYNILCKFWVRLKIEGNVEFFNLFLFFGNLRCKNYVLNCKL